MFDRREEPDGEETIAKNSLNLVMQQSSSSSSSSSHSALNAVMNFESVRVPNWIQSDATLEVVFNERATAQIDEFQIDRVRLYN